MTAAVASGESAFRSFRYRSALRLGRGRNRDAPVVRDEIQDVVALGGRILRVAAHVEAKPGPVPQDHAAAPALRHHAPEQVPSHLVRRQPTAATEDVRGAVLGLKAEDPPVHTLRLRSARPDGNSKCQWTYNS